MNRLTHERVNGIKTGYWSAAKKDELVHRLAEYENIGLEPEEIMDGRLLTGWIPVEECLPADDEMVLVSCMTMKGVKSVNRAYYSGGTWHGSGSMSRVQAWMPMPEPYEVGEIERRTQ